MLSQPTHEGRNFGVALRLSYLSKFSLKFAPDSIQSGEWDGLGARRATSIGGLAMGPAYPPQSKQSFLDEQECLDESAFRGEEHTDDEHSDSVIPAVISPIAGVKWDLIAKIKVAYSQLR